LGKRFFLPLLAVEPRFVACPAFSLVNLYSHSADWRRPKLTMWSPFMAVLIFAAVVCFQLGSCRKYELQQDKLWFGEECWVRVLDRRKQAEMRWLQDPNQSIVDNLNNVRLEASRHFRNKKKEYLKAKIDELDTNSAIMKTETFVGASVILRRVTSLELIL